MVTGISLTSAVEVVRGDGAVGWSGVSGTSGECGGFSPGLKGHYLRLKLVPDDPLPVLPAALPLTMVAGWDDDETYTDIFDDVVGLGDSSAPVTANSALGTKVTGGTRQYSVSTAGVSLSDLNAGNVYLFIAFRASPATNEYPAGWSLAISPSTAPQEQYGAGLVSDLTTNYQVTASKAGTAATYVVAQLQATCFGSGKTDPGVGGAPPQLWEGSMEATALGQTSSMEFSSPPDPGGPTTATIQYTRSRRLTPGVASGFPVRANTVLTSAGADIVAYSTTTLSGLVVSPSASTLTLTSLSMTYEPLGGLVDGLQIAGGDDEEMTTRYIDDAVTVYWQAVRYADGTAMDATGTPGFRVYEEATGTPVQTGSLALLDSGNTDGLYTGSFTASAANGFEVGKSYAVVVQGTVDGIAQAWIVEKFVVRAAVPDAVWGAPLAAEAAGAPTTYGGALRRIFTKLANRMTKSGNIVRTYADDGTTVVASAQYSVTGEGFDRSRDQ